MNTRPAIRRIGIFDSGAGGLTVLRVLRQSFPGVRFTYLGDTARLPYGTKSAETIIRYTIQNAAFLLKRKVDLLIVACNTASAHALESLSQFTQLPVIGVIEPGAHKASMISRSGTIGVIGTQGTVSSGMYTRFIHQYRYDAVVLAKAAPLLVPLVEEGLVSGEIAEGAIRLYVDPLMEQGIDTLVLGCTHYPLLRDTIGRLYPGLHLVDSATPIRDELQQDYVFADQQGRTEIYITDYPETFVPLSERFLGSSVDRIEHVDLQKLWRKRS